MSASPNLDKAIEAIHAAMARGEQTHQPGEWLHRTAEFHIARAIQHLELFQEGDTREPHLCHAATRLLMALELAIAWPPWIQRQEVERED